jgi:hypothetical protein
MPIKAKETAVERMAEKKQSVRVKLCRTSGLCLLKKINHLFKMSGRLFCGLPVGSRMTPPESQRNVGSHRAGGLVLSLE